MKPILLSRLKRILFPLHLSVLCSLFFAFTATALPINVRGRAVDTHGQPVAGAKVALLKNRGLDSTDGNGKFSIAASVGSIATGSVTSQGALTFLIKSDRLVIENSQRSAFSFQLLSLDGRRVFSLERKALPSVNRTFSCPLGGLAPGLYVAHLTYNGKQSVTMVAFLPNTGWRHTVTVGGFVPLHRKSSIILDTLMLYKKGYRSIYAPLETADADLGDLTMLADTVHKEKFIIFVRDSLTEMLPPTSCWEYDPVKKTFAKKIDFSFSSWAPNLLLDAKTPEYVRQQVNKAANYDAFLYKIDYCSWRAETLMVSPQVLGLGSTSTQVFLYTDQGRVILDRQSGALTSMESFTMITQFKDCWLVTQNKPDTAYLFSPAENKFKKTLVSSTKFSTQDRYWMSDDGRFLAQCKAVGGSLPFGKAVSVPSTIVLFSLDNDSLGAFPITIYCAAGSGVPVIYASLRCWFSDDGTFNYVSALREGDTLISFSDSSLINKCELISIHLQTLTTTSAPASAAVFGPQFTPQFLPQYLDSLRGKVYYQDQVIESFLSLFGISTTAREYGLSLDGKRFLGRFNRGGSAAPNTGFIYGDLENRWIERLPDPGRPLANLYSEIHVYGIADTCK
jgi:hypothetical protein